MALSKAQVRLTAALGCLKASSSLLTAMSALSDLSANLAADRTPSLTPSFQKSLSAMWLESLISLRPFLRATSNGSSTTRNARHLARSVLFMLAIASVWTRLKRWTSFFGERFSRLRLLALSVKWRLFLRSDETLSSRNRPRPGAQVDLSRKVSLVVGHSGYGKGVWTGHAVAGCERLLISNPFPDKNEFDAQRIVGFKNLLEFFKAKPAKFRVAYTPEICTKPCCKGKRTDFIHLIELAWVIRRLTFVVDEVAASRHLPRRMPVPMAFIDMATMGRHREISMIMTAQRPYYLPIEIRSESDELVCFNLTEERDRDWIAGYPGAREIAEETSVLPRLAYLKFTKEPQRVTRGRLEL